MKTHAPHKSAALVVLIALLPCAALRSQTTPEMTFRPSLLSQTALSYSFAGNANVRNDGISGSTLVHHFDTSASTQHPIDKGIFWSDGFAFSMNWIVSDAGVPAPVRLGELSLNYGYTRALAPGLTLMTFARPGYYADFSHWTWKTLNVPVMAAVTYAPNPRLLWIFGASFNYFNRYPVMPAIGLRWKFADKWTLNLGIPRFGVSWQVSDLYDLGAFVSGQGGSFRTTRAPRDPALASTYVDYREMRAGLRLTFKDKNPPTTTTRTTTTTTTTATPTGTKTETNTRTRTRTTPPANTSLEIGCMLLRHFNYYKPGFTLRESPAFYVSFSVGAKP